MRKTQRPTGAKVKKAKAETKRGAGSRPAAARIPVRGSSKSASKSGGGKAGPSKLKLNRRGLAPEAPKPSRSQADLQATRELAVAAMEAALDKRALDPVLIDVSGMGSYTDFIGIVSGRSDRQVDAIAESVSQTMKARGIYALGREGSGNGRWTLLDFGAFVIHVFYHPVREFYDLESLWIEAPRVKLAVPPESSLAQADALYGAL
ncbi:MAG TPA: ribosome silencing factor [Polyangia bacterium]|nr:ribosome silencing factor [Polyangia bacterium]